MNVYILVYLNRRLEKVKKNKGISEEEISED